jgi:hypothetical protein
MKDHGSMCALIDWIINMKCENVKNASDLAKRIGKITPRLSTYRNGQRGRLELTQMRAFLMRSFLRIGLPNSIPANAASLGGSGADPARAAACVQPIPPALNGNRPILEVDLSAKGSQQGGEVQIICIGEPVPSDHRWSIPCPGLPQKTLHLRRGFSTGRRTLGKEVAKPLRGLNFEFWIDSLNEPTDLGQHGGPLWCARRWHPNNPLKTMAETLIVGRQRGQGGKGSYKGCSSAERLCVESYRCALRVQCALARV